MISTKAQTVMDKLNAYDWVDYAGLIGRERLDTGRPDEDAIDFLKENGIATDQQSVHIKFPNIWKQKAESEFEAFVFYEQDKVLILEEYYDICPFSGDFGMPDDKTKEVKGVMEYSDFINYMDSLPKMNFLYRLL